MNVSTDGGAGLPAERAGIGTSEMLFEGEESTGLVMPRPALSCVAAAVVDDVRSGWLTVGVVGEGIDLSVLEVEADGFSVEALSESPRAGRSTRWLELKEEPDVSGESCNAAGGEDPKVGSIRGRLSRADISLGGELFSCSCGGVFESESLRFDSAFLLFGTSCNLKGSVADEGAGDSRGLRDRCSVTGDSLLPSFLFLSVSTSVSDGCLPFSW